MQNISTLQYKVLSFRQELYIFNGLGHMEKEKPRYRDDGGASFYL
jgi:hypothetical protein